MAPKQATFYYSALDFGVADYKPAQNADRSADDDNVVHARWMVPLYRERDRLTSVAGYISWNSIATTTANGNLSVTENIAVRTGNKTMMLINGYTNSNGYYQLGEKHRALITQGSLSPEADKPFEVSNKKYITIQKMEDRGNWRQVKLSPTLPN